MKEISRGEVDLWCYFDAFKRAGINFSLIKGHALACTFLWLGGLWLGGKWKVWKGRIIGRIWERFVEGFREMDFLCFRERRKFMDVMYK